MIDGLFKPNADGSDDDGIMRSVLTLKILIRFLPLHKIIRCDFLNH